MSEVSSDGSIGARYVLNGDQLNRTGLESQGENRLPVRCAFW
jgi:hypothetical protein